MDVKDSLHPGITKSRWELTRKLWLWVTNWIRLKKWRRLGGHLGVNFGIWLAIYSRSRIFLISRSYPFHRRPNNWPIQSGHESTNLNPGWLFLVSPHSPIKFWFFNNNLNWQGTTIGLPCNNFLSFPWGQTLASTPRYNQMWPSIPNHYHCLVIMADDEAKTKIPILEGIK